jgi:hypothetical protein
VLLTQAVCCLSISTWQDAVVIGARLDSNSSGESCRLAFYGRLLVQLGSGTPQELKRLLVYKVNPILIRGLRGSGLCIWANLSRVQESVHHHVRC